MRCSTQNIHRSYHRKHEAAKRVSDYLHLQESRYRRFYKKKVVPMQTTTSPLYLISKSGKLMLKWKGGIPLENTRVLFLKKQEHSEVHDAVPILKALSHTLNSYEKKGGITAVHWSAWWSALECMQRERPSYFLPKPRFLLQQMSMCSEQCTLPLPISCQ